MGKYENGYDASRRPAFNSTQRDATPSEGYKSTYEDSYNGNPPPWYVMFWYAAVASMDDTSTGSQMYGGKDAGERDGKSDRKSGRINRLNPKSSMKNNLPLLNIVKKESKKSKENEKK